MSVPELYEAYASGRISRGAFIRRMVGFGMTASVAAAYAAGVARPEQAQAAKGGNSGSYGRYYGLYYKSPYYGRR